MDRIEYVLIRANTEIGISTTTPFGAALAEFEADDDGNGYVAWQGSNDTIYSLTENRSMFVGSLQGAWLLAKVDYVQPDDPGLPPDETSKFWRRHTILATGTKAEVKGHCPVDNPAELTLIKSWNKGAPRYSPGGWRGQGGRPKRTDGTVIWNLPMQSTPEDKEAFYQLLRDCGGTSLRERYDLLVSLLTEHQGESEE